MALFNASAWMMKGSGGGTAALDLTSGDDDPYKKGKTLVNLVIASPELNITNNKSKFILKFKIVETGFTEDPSNVSFRFELTVDGHWRYTNTLETVNLSKQGTIVSVDLSKKINGNSQLKSQLISSKKLYLLFETGTEICRDQIECTKKIS